MVANPNRKTGQDNPIQSHVDTFRLVAETRRQVNEVAESAREAIQASYTDPELLAGFIERHGTPVYVLPVGFLATFMLRALGFEPGFIPPGRDIRFNRLKRLLAFYDRLCSGMNRPDRNQTDGKLMDNSSRIDRHGVFVLTRPLFTVGFLTHQLHHWLAFRSGMAGYCERAQRLYKKFWVENQGQIGREVYKMSAEDILALKAAINRDMEALRFLKAMADEVLIPAKQARRISGGNASA